MAKKEEGLKYLQMPLPQARAAYKSVKINWSGLNLSDDHDTGELSMEHNISTEDAPYLTPSQLPYDMAALQDASYKPLSMYGFDDYLVIIYSVNYYIYAKFVKTNANNSVVYDSDCFICRLNPDKATINDEYDRNIVQFNVYNSATDVVGGEYIKRLLVFPDRVSMPVMSDMAKVTGNFSYTVVDGTTETGIITITGRYEDYSQDHTGIANKVYFFTQNEGTCYMYDDGWEEMDEWGVYRFTYTDETQVEEDYIIEDGAVKLPKSVYKFTDGYYKYKNGKLVFENTNYFTPDKMTVNIKTFADTEDHLPPKTASARYYWKNLSTNVIYEWVDDDADSENSGWKVTSVPNMPPIKYATVHLSRLFGVDDSRVYASGFNDYANWNLDTIDEYNESNAWCSPAQSNVKADGVFTGITTFENHVICFKKDFMHEIYGTKNPFRIQDIYAEGAIDNRTIQNVDGRLIFVSSDGVKIYTGGNPRIISLKLDIKEYVYAVSGNDGRCYYLYCDNYDGDDEEATQQEQAAIVRRLLVFDTYTGEWSEREIGARVRNFATTKNGTYILCKKGSGTYPKVYRLNSGVYSTQNWSFETDLMTRQGRTPTVDIKHIKKIQMLADFVGNPNSNASLKIYALYDGESYDASKSQLLYDSNPVSTKKTVPIRVKARKSAHYSLKLHFEGVGYVKIYEMELFFEQGGDLYVP